MDLNMLLILGFIVIVFGTLMGTLGDIAKRQMRLKEKTLEAEIAGRSVGLDRETAARIEQMEQRLRVLERIATDRGSNVSADLVREIEALRHGQDSEDRGVPLALKEKAQ